MSHKINSNAMRLGHTHLANAKTWSSLWYASPKDYTKLLHQDLAIRKLVTTKLQAAGVDRVSIKRSVNTALVEISVGKPGVAIGRGGTGIEELTMAVRKLAKNKGIEVKVKEVKKADLSPRILAEEIATGLKRRMSAKLLAKSVVTKAMSAGALGIKVWIGGRINGSKQARVVKFSEGAVPLHTLKADIDFASLAADTMDFGKYGIKIWVLLPAEKIN